MTQQEILEKGCWVSDNQFVVHVENHFLKNKVRFEVDFNNNDGDKKLSSYSIKAINDFLSLKGSDWNWIKEELFKACHDAFQMTSYGFDGAPRKENQSEFEANQDLFQIYSSDDAFEKSNLRSVSVGNDLSYSCFYMVFEVPWDNEHSVNFSFIDGQKPFVD